jgi:hypothetical protein
MSAVGTAAASLGKELLILHASSEDDLATAFATMIQQRREALLVASSLRLQVAFRFLQLCH